MKRSWPEAVALFLVNMPAEVRAQFMEYRYPDWIGLLSGKARAWTDMSAGDKETILLVMEKHALEARGP